MALYLSGEGGGRATKPLGQWLQQSIYLEPEWTSDGEHSGSSCLWSPSPPVLEPPGVPTTVSAIVVVWTGVALATQAWWLRALLRLIAAQYKVTVWKTDARKPGLSTHSDIRYSRPKSG